MNSKQLFLTTALITSLSSTAMADVSISGKAKVNTKGGDHNMEANIITTFKTGDTSVVAQIGLDNSNIVEQLYMKSSIAGVNIKSGQWKTNKDELKKIVTKEGIQVSVPFGVQTNDIYTDDIDNLSCHNGNSCFELVWQDMTGSGGEYVMVKGSLVGVKFLHKDTSGGKKETKVLGSMGGIDVAYHFKDYDNGNIDDSYTVKNSVQGIDLTYVNTTSDAGTMMDGFIGKRTGVTEANAFGISTTIAGNKVTYKGIVTDGTDNKKLIITRKIASGSTFEAT